MSLSSRAPVLLGVLAAFALHIPSAGAGSTEIAKTPKELFAKLAACHDAKAKATNVCAVWALGTQDSLHFMGPLVLRIAASATRKDPALGARVKAILKRSGYVKRSELKSPRGLGKGSVDRSIAYGKKVFAGVKDLSGLLRELGAVVMEAESKKKGRLSSPFKLKELTVTGDTALAIVVTQPRPGAKERPMPLHFAKEGKAGWKIDFVGPMRKKEQARAKRRARSKKTESKKTEAKKTESKKTG